jgi:hypothetical protein
MTDDVSKLVAHIVAKVGEISVASPDDAYPYASVPLCVIDAVFSLGVRYESTWRTVCSWSERHNWEMCRWRSREQRTVTDFIQVLQPYAFCFEDMARKVFCNRHRTSPRSGILKAKAVYLFATTLKSFGVETMEDASQFQIQSKLRTEIEKIPGQGSGLSYNYFLMLTGHEDAVKADRMVRRFVCDALNLRDVSPHRAEQLVRKASVVLRPDFPQLIPSLLDNEIWKYQRNLTGARSTSRHGQVMPWVAAAKDCARQKFKLRP